MPPSTRPSQANGASDTPSYLCPMHAEVRQAIPGTCPRCGMDLVPEGARSGILRHMASMPKHMLRKPWMLVAMGVVMAAVMAALMMR